MKTVQLDTHLMALRAITIQPSLKCSMKRSKGVSNGFAVAPIVEPPYSSHGIALVMRESCCAFYEMPEVIVPVAQVVDDLVAFFCAEASFDAAPFP